MSATILDKRNQELFAMGKRARRAILTLAMGIVVVPIPFVFAQNSKPSPASKENFDPHDLSGVWVGEDIPANDRWANLAPEPPLTEWARQHLLYKSISHDPLSGKLKDPKLTPTPGMPASKRSFYATDLYGVVANDPYGEYPGKECEPLSTPAMFDYPGLARMEIVPTREGDRLYQFIEYHREWRTFWMNREHPKDLDPTYEGDSTAHWDGNDLVVDTLGYNGKTMISGAVGHSKSEAFRLVERYRRVDATHMQIEMTYYDPKAWGDKSWGGFRKYYVRAPKEDFIEFICSPREYMQYDKSITTPLNAPPAKK
jgi:hypothetical protein